MRIAIVIPCLNESASIASVVRDCREYMPQARVCVLDNGSDDQTAEMALNAGAEVIHFPKRGKGLVLQHAFAVIDADYYVLIDGDGTYPVHEMPRLLDAAIQSGSDMVCGSRLKIGRPEAFRPLHFVGNKFFTGLVRILFGHPVQDLLTGFRVFSRSFVKDQQLKSTGFEIETELTIRALAQRRPFLEIPITYEKRHEGGKSKLRTFRDGWKILLTILRLFMAPPATAAKVPESHNGDQDRRSA